MTIYATNRFDVRNVVAIFVFCCVCALIHARWLSTQNLNSDEAWYQAHASFLVENGLTAFDTPLSAIYIINFYEIFARLFGDYNIVPVRIWIAAISLTMSYGIFLVVRRAVGWLCGAIAGLIFLLYSPCFEGLAANREWLAMPVLFLASSVYLQTTRAASDKEISWRALLLTGALGGISVWLKDQSIFLLMVVPLDIAFRSIAARRPRIVLRGSFWYGTGIAIGGVFGAIPLIAAHTFTTHVTAVVNFEANRVGAPWMSSMLGRLSMYTHGFYHNVPFHWLFLGACLMALVSLVASIHRAWTGILDFDTPRDATVRVFSWSLICSLIAIQTGGQFFRHYFLYALPAIAILLSIVIEDLLRAVRGQSRPAVLWLLVGCLTLEKFFPLLTAAKQLLHVQIGLDRWPFAIFAAISLVSLAVFIYLITRSQRRMVLRIFVVGCLAFLTFQIGRLFVEVAVRPANTVLSLRYPYDFEPLRTWLADHGRQDDRLFVWGWRPELYTLSGRPAASQFVTSTYIMSDGSELADWAPQYNRQRSAMLISELETHPPPLIIDAWAHSLYGARCRVKYCPPLETLLSNQYRLATSIDGCDVYARRDPSEPKEPVIVELAHDVRTVRNALAVLPNDPMLMLNLADLLAQEHQFARARAEYEKIQQRYPSWGLVQNRLASLKLAMGNR